MAALSASLFVTDPDRRSIRTPLVVGILVLYPTVPWWRPVSFGQVRPSSFPLSS